MFLEQKNEEQKNDQDQDYSANPDVHLDSSFSICSVAPILCGIGAPRRQFVSLNSDNEITNAATGGLGGGGVPCQNAVEAA